MTPTQIFILSIATRAGVMSSVWDSRCGKHLNEFLLIAQYIIGVHKRFPANWSVIVSLVLQKDSASQVSIRSSHVTNLSNDPRLLTYVTVDDNQHPNVTVYRIVDSLGTHAEVSVEGSNDMVQTLLDAAYATGAESLPLPAYAAVKLDTFINSAMNTALRLHKAVPEDPTIFKIHMIIASEGEIVSIHFQTDIE